MSTLQSLEASNQLEEGLKGLPPARRFAAVKAARQRRLAELADVPATHPLAAEVIRKAASVRWSDRYERDIRSALRKWSWDELVNRVKLYEAGRDVGFEAVTVLFCAEEIVRRMNGGE